MGNDPIGRLERGMEAFTPSEAAAARYFIAHPSSVINKTISKAAEEAGLTNTSIMRMCQRAGYSGYAEFRFSMNRYLLSRGDEPIGGSEPADSLSFLADAYALYAHKLADGIDREQLKRFATIIYQARRISIWGANRTYESVKQLSIRLMRIGIFNQTTSDPQVMDDISTILGEGDLCIVISLNGRGNRSYGSLMGSLRDRGCAVFLITMNPKVSCAQKASEVVVLPWISNDYASRHALEDQIVVFLYLECLLREVAGMAGSED